MVDYAHVVQRLGPPVGLDQDANGSPDFVPLTEGVVIFVPTTLVKSAADGVTVAIPQAPIVATLTAAGYLTYGGTLGVDLPDLGASGVTPSIPRDQAAYVVTYRGLRYQGQPFRMPDVSINPAAGATFDLTNAIPLDLPAGITSDQLQAIATAAIAAQSAAEAAVTAAQTAQQAAEDAASTAAAPTDAMVAGLIPNAATATGAAVSAMVDGSISQQVPATRVQAWGHSYMAGVGIGMTLGVNDMATLIAADRSLPLANKAVGGTALYNSLSADSNWVSVLREVKRPTKFVPLTGLYPTMYGINDVNSLGLTAPEMAPFFAALRFIVSRYRSGGVFSSTDPSVTFGGSGVWANAVDQPYVGEWLRYNTTAGGTVTITTDAKFPGGYVVPLVLSWTDAGSGAVFTGSGDAAGYSVDTKAIAHTGSKDVACIRILAKPGIGTYTFTTSAIVGPVGAAFFGWQWEPANTDGPMVPLILQPKPLDYTNYGAGGPDGPPTDASVDVLNAGIATVAAEFGARVFTVDTSVMDKSTSYFTSGNIHPTVAGHAKLAELTNAAIEAHGNTPPIPTDVADLVVPVAAAGAAAAWKSYTPTLGGTGTTQGNATTSGGYYEDAAGTLFFWGRCVIGSTTAVGSSMTLTMPQAEISHAAMSAWAQRAGVGSFQLAADVSPSALNAVRLWAIGVNGAVGYVNSTTPFAWVTGDSFDARGVIQTTPG